MLKTITKSEYQAPYIEVLEARVECGFRISGFFTGSIGSSTESIELEEEYDESSFSSVFGGEAGGGGNGGGGNFYGDIF